MRTLLYINEDSIMLNKFQKAALLSEAGMLGRLLVATAAVASLHGLIATYVAVILATLGSALLTVRIVTLNNSVRVAKELSVFREFVYAALFISWATGAFQMGIIVYFLLYMVLLTLVGELILLKKH